MIQNISEEFETDENLKKGESKEKEIVGIDIKEILKGLFSVNNTIIYVLTLMISMVGIGADTSIAIAPFGIALVAASISNGVPIFVVYLASLIGTAIGFGTNTAFMYVASSVIMLLLVLIKKPAKYEDETEQYKLGTYLFFSVLIASFIKMIFTRFYFYDVLVTLTLSVTAYIFYKIFANSLDVITKYGKKRVFSVEEIVGASLLIAIAISSFGSFSIYGFSVRNILCIFLVLALGWKNGILVGGVSGITAGIVLGIIGDGNPILIAAYSICGMLSGVLNRFGKIGVILGFVLGNIIVAYSANGGTNNIIQFQEILIASIGLIVLPKRTRISIDKFISKTKLLPEGVGRIEEGSETLLKLNNISKTISDMSDNYRKDDFYEKNLEIFEYEVQKNIQKIESNILFDYIDNNENDMIQDLFDYIVENGVLTENGMLSILAKSNIFLMNSDDKESRLSELAEIRSMIKVINSAFNTCKKSAVWQRKIYENNLNVSAQLNSVKNAIDTITDEIQNEKNNFDVFFNTKEVLKNNLIDENILIKDIKIKKEPSGRLNLKVYTDICDGTSGDKCPIKKILKYANKATNEKLVIQSQKCGIRLEKNTCEFTYIFEDKYYIQTGVATTKKNGSIVSGDMTSQARLEDGKCLLALSDGMGSGPEARKNSKIAISMLERLLTSGFDKETSINLINSTILTANRDEMYATLDIEIFDLYAGKIQLLKSGACPTFIKNNREVRMVKSSSLPAGIMKEIKIDTYDVDLEDESIIVMCSDGIIEANNEYANKELWIKHLLEDIQTDRPERIASIILREAVDSNYGKPKDDMSVIVAKVIKK